jgi:tetratricopeptide (TPR) repeat protein
VTDRYSGSLIASWDGPPGISFVNWSSDGHKLTIAGGWGSDLGLWIYDMATRKPSKVLSGRITRGRYSPDGKRMAFAFGPPLYEIWVADTESLGPNRTLDEHYQEMVDRFARRIDTDPDYARNYFWRAVYGINLGDRKRVLEDLEKYADTINKPWAAAQAYDITAWSVVGRYQKKVNPEIGVELYQKAHQIKPKDWRYLRGLGAAYYRTGQWQEAITTLKKSTELVGGENALNYLLLGMVHWQSGDRSEATNWYNKAIEWIESNDIDWHANRAQMIYDIYLEASELMGIKLKHF